MQFSWSLESIPELSELSSEERSRVWWAACWKAHRHWQAWIGFVGLCLCAYFGMTLGNMIGLPFTGIWAGVAIGGAIYWQVLVQLKRPYLRAHVSEREPHR